MDTKTADYLYNENRQRFMEDYQEAVNYLLEITKIGVGVRPMSFLAMSHAEINRWRIQWHKSYLKANEENKKLRAENDRLKQGYDTRGKTIDAMEEDFAEISKSLGGESDVQLPEQARRLRDENARLLEKLDLALTALRMKSSERMNVLEDENARLTERIAQLEEQARRRADDDFERGLRNR